MNDRAICLPEDKNFGLTPQGQTVVYGTIYKFLVCQYPLENHPQGHTLISPFPIQLLHHSYITVVSHVMVTILLTLMVRRGIFPCNNAIVPMWYLTLLYLDYCVKQFTVHTRTNHGLGVPTFILEVPLMSNCQVGLPMPCALCVHTNLPIHMLH